MSTEARKISEIILDFVLSFTISNIGIVANVLVIMVFIKQGFKESVNISMTTIAVWDLAKCLAASLQRMAGPMATWSEADAESWTNISVVAFSHLICYSTYVTSVLAAYVAVERCLCVCIPFKVKWLITPKVALSISLTISVVIFGLFVVMSGIYDIVWVYSDVYNQTIAVYLKNDFYYANEYPLFEYYNLSGILWPLASFVVIIFCTLIIVHKLKESTKFRSGHAEAKGQSTIQLSTRDKQVVKMLLVIVGVYVFSLFPRIAHYIAKYIIHEFYFLRLYHNFFVCVTYFLYIFDLVNGAVNFFIFFAMSTSFRATFYKMFKRRKQTNNNNLTECSNIDASA
ncbi:unnamed protein product [Candidula unifasciata]|uniref:G-protein coupled receptors family 1 profile domain-containing protein n=1 Tax=Candidula unifasciata TaxID=100452 RepID=A0A8S3YP70_9EUPU|nr:unnamed protein product [Candidula unifasciata]